MTKTFFCIKQGSRLSLGYPTTRTEFNRPGSSPYFFLSTLPEALMEINPAYKDVPFIQEKLKKLKHLLRSDRVTITALEAAEPDYPLLPQIKEQHKRNLKIWVDITGGQPCP